MKIEILLNICVRLKKKLIFKFIYFDIIILIITINIILFIIIII